MNRYKSIRQIVLCMLAVSMIVIPAAGGLHNRTAAQIDGAVALAYVYQNTVTLADASGQAVEPTGPTFTYGQGARLFWTADGMTLYIARDDGLYATGARGGAAAKIPGYYGRTIAISQDARMLYYLESTAPQDVTGGSVAFPLRDLDLTLLDGGVGRLTGYFGRYEPGASRADVSFAAASYVRDGGLLGMGRPNLWPTYGSNIFGTCCFPAPGLALYDPGTGDFWVYDDAFLPGAAAANSTRSHLAGPTTGGVIRVIDLITGGTRDFAPDIAGGLGTVERIAWAPDDTALYIMARREANTPLTLTAGPPFSVDIRSANMVLYRLNLVNGLIRELAWRPDVYGVSSLAATQNYVFAVVVDPNTALVNAINNGQIAAGTSPTDPALRGYMPATHLWRIDVTSGAVDDIHDDVWGVVARPIR
ncbi:MAG: hypothetical protein JW966_04275 [Anaerolineae bacterium]|nr:hypothetical protein [Anaerolineae bacterium]